MFGGLSYLLNGNMCCGVIKDDLVIRVGLEQYKKALAMPHARPMDFTGMSIKGIVYVDPNVWSKGTYLKKWVQIGIDYTSSLPKKK